MLLAPATGGIGPASAHGNAGNSRLAAGPRTGQWGRRLGLPPLRSYRRRKPTVAIAAPARLAAWLLAGAIPPTGSAANSSWFGNGVIVSA